MTVKEFVEKYKNANNPTMFVGKHIVKSYIGYMDKVSMCETVVKNTSYYKEIRNEQERTVFYLNSPARYMFYCLSVIQHYTDLEINMKNGVEQFDLLDSEGLIDKILNAIPTTEIVKIDTILKMLVEDMLENERSFAGYMDIKLNSTDTFLSMLDSNTTIATKTKSLFKK